MTDPDDPMREFVNRLIPPPPQVDETDENGQPVDPWRLAVRRMFAQDEDA